ncbi:MAG: class B sortase [Eubacteriales bacterium]|nr:class B sortase [Eubacteriales bacterium]
MTGTKRMALLIGLCSAALLLACCGAGGAQTKGRAMESSGEQADTAAGGTGPTAAEVIASDKTIPEKLSQLKEINGDVYAWLEIPGTDISFPVLQSAEDTAFYLGHNEDKEQDDGGSIYTEYENSKDFTDYNTVIYGRNVDSRFGRLHQYQDRDFFDEYRRLLIYLPERTLEYRIFAAYDYDDRHLLAAFDFSDTTVYSNYLEDVFAIRRIDAFIDADTEVTAQDKILTLSTGVTGQDERRYLVQAVLEEQ